MMSPSSGGKELSAGEKREWIARLLKEKRSAGGRTAPLSFAQQRLWFLDRMLPGAAQYNIPLRLSLEGRLQIPAMERALTELVRRHEALRTTFGMSEGEPIQIVGAPWSVELSPLDLRSLPEACRQEELQRLSHEEAVRSFDLSQGPLLRVVLVRTSETVHVLLLTQHHIISDGWSLGILFRELAALYTAFVREESSPLAELPIQYADFSDWQREWLQGETLQRQLGYWTRRLEGAEALRLPTDHPRPAGVSFRGASDRRILAPSLCEDLKRLSQREGATLFMTMLAAFQSFLFRCTGQEDLTVGTPIANRNRHEIEGLVGFFVNNLSLRVRLKPDEPFRELLRRVRGLTLEAYDHQDVPFERLVEELNPERDITRHPLFQVTLSVQNAPMQSKWELPDLRVTLLKGTTEVTRYDLEVHIAEQPEGLAVAMVYNPDLLDPATVSRWLDQYSRLLEGVALDCDQPIVDLPLLSEEDANRMLVEWNRTDVAWPDVCLQTLIEEQVGRQAEETAVIFGEETLSYRALDVRANQLARHLQRLGVGPDVLVGICMERGVELVVALLGVLKAGGAYVPLDPSYPADRLQFMVRDSRAPVLLTQGRLKARLPDVEAEIVYCDLERPVWEEESGEAPRCEAGPENLAYVIYTSGSTGQPKGVMIPHRAVVNHMLWMQGLFPLNRHDRVLQKTAFSFDASVWEFYAPLVAGAKLVLADPAATHDLPRLIEEVRRHKVTILQVVPTLLRHLLDEESFAQVKTLRRVFAGGEALTPDLQEKFFSTFSCELHNLYGPTEACIDATFWTCRRGTADGSVPIGRPIANMQAYVLDEQMRVVPIGIPGELHLAGRGIARGYWQRDDLTRERFVPDPFGRTPGSRLYRTGDLARYRTDGALEFLGRKDDQVKVRGNRVELSEVESALSQHESVGNCAVIVRQDGTGAGFLVAYIVPMAATGFDAGVVKAHLQTRLPDYMVPTVIVKLDALPVLPQGKVDRRALSLLPLERPEESEAVVPQTELERKIAGIWAELLDLKEVGRHQNFFDLGGHSLSLMLAHNRLQKVIERPIEVVELFEHPTVAALARHLSGTKPEPSAVEVKSEVASGETDIAVIGMAGRFPGADNVERFWQNLRQGVESISFFSEEELVAEGLDRGLVRSPNYVRAKGVLEGADLFDAGFFGYSPREAEITDPQQRLFLECAWEALEDAGYDPTRYGERIGVFAGVGFNTYLGQLREHPELLRQVGGFQLLTSNDKDHLPTRVSYKLNLRGPSVSVQTACSTSLVAVHLACQSLRQGEAEIALAGGVTITVPLKSGYSYIEEGIGSPDGHCRAFDARGQGTVGGNGVGIVVLKRLSVALRDGDSILAVIRGSAINNDGSSKVGYTAPSVSGQAAVIRAAQVAVEPESIGYIEAHGTGTALGDPIEVEALMQAFRVRGATKKNFCALGSVKSNVGHLDAAAGVTSLIKVVLGLKHREIPPTLHVDQPHPKIPFADSPFFINDRLREWPKWEKPRRAGVSSFGIGGTNAHVAVEEAPARSASGASRPWQLLPVSARSAGALEESCDNLRRHLQEGPDQPLADVAYTLQVGRRSFEHRCLVKCRDHSEAIEALARPGGHFSGVAASDERPVVFMFSGQGSQYLNMGRELYESESAFREAVEECTELLRPHLGGDLKSVLYPEKETEEARVRLDETFWTQPALFTVEWALSRLWGEWGVQPEAMIGHSIGEYVAATLASVFSLEDALRLVAVRGRLMQSLKAGAMLAVPLSAGEAEELLHEHPDCSLAAANAPRSSVISGPVESIAALSQVLSERVTMSRRLHTTRAFHSAMVEPILEAFEREIQSVRLNPPRIRFVSNVTGRWIEPSQATDPRYWVEQIRKPVRFSDGVQELLAEPARIFVEVGPGRALAQLGRQHLTPDQQRLVVHSIRAVHEDRGDQEHIQEVLARLWVGGANVSWEGYSKRESRHRVSLPTYPFERQRYWISAPASQRSVSSRGSVMKDEDPASWFYVPGWKRTEVPELAIDASLMSEGARWLLFVDELGVGAALGQSLTALGQEVVVVQKGAKFARLDRGRFTVRPEAPADYDSLWSELSDVQHVPDRIVHLWSVYPGAGVKPNRESFDQAQTVGFTSLLYLVQALARIHHTAPVRLDAVSSELHAVIEEDQPCPEKATLLGLCRVIPQEYANITCRSIDLATPSTGADGALFVRQLLNELRRPAVDPVVAYRSGFRWAQVFEAVSLPALDVTKRLQSGFVCLITGGLGRVGLVLAEFLARTLQARLVLVGRSAFPARTDWEEWLSTHPEGDETARRIRRLLKLEEMGGEVVVMQADAGDWGQMAAVVQKTEERFGNLEGVIHAAGCGKSIPLQDSGRAECEEQYRSKVDGVLALEKALAGRQLEFCLMMSSLASILGGVGFAGYAAANQYLDAYAQWRRRAGLGHWMSVNWDGWDLRERRAESAVGDGTVARLALSAAEGTEAWTRTLALTGVPQVAVSTGDLLARMKQWIEPQSPAAKERSMPSGHDTRAPADARPGRTAPQNETEQLVAEVWQEALGVPAVAVEDNFFELGGNSLIAVQMLPRLREAFRIDLPVHAIFDAPTVESLARRIAEAGAASGGENQRLEQLLALVEEKSTADLHDLLSSERQSHDQ